MNSNNSLWISQYRPTKLSDVIGHTKQIKQLKEWLKSFHKTDKKMPPIMFLYGPSGIGKTLLSFVLLSCANYHIYELNAGEIRSKKRITNILDKILPTFPRNR